MDKPNYVDLSTSNDYKIEDRFNNTHDSIGTESNSPQSVQNGGFFWSSNKSNNDSKCLIAARTKDYSVVDFMLNHEMISNLCTQDSNGNTLLHYLVKDSNTNSKAVSILNNVLGRKDLNNYINIQNNSGNTPLIDAVVSGNMKLCNNLIALGADKNIRNEEGLHVSAEQTDAAVQSGGISDNNYSPTSDFSVTEEQKDFNSLFVKDSAAFTASESNMPDKLTITESNVQSDVRNSDTFIRNLDNKLDSNNAPERNTEQFLNFLEQKYITGNQEGGVYTRHVKLGNRNLRYYGNEHSYEGSASDAELSRMIKNQASEIHDRVIKKIMELLKVDEETAGHYKAGLYQMVKDKPEQLSNLDRAIEMEKLTNKKVLDTIDIDRISRERKEKREQREKEKGSDKSDDIKATIIKEKKPATKADKKPTAAKADKKPTAAKKSKKESAWTDNSVSISETSRASPYNAIMSQTSWSSSEEDLFN